MLKKTIFCIAAAAASSSAMAQAGPVAQVSPDQLVCQLSGDCEKNEAAPTQDKPDSRGFSIARRVGTTPAAQVATPQRDVSSHLVSPAARSMPSSARRVVLRPAGQVGRANLAINFVTGSAELTESGKAQAMAVAEALRSPQLSGKRFMIGGHTDAVGTRALNLDLSQRRAQSVVDFLVAQGAGRSQFDVKGFGFDNPLPGTSPKSGSNRRVEVIKLD